MTIFKTLSNILNSTVRKSYGLLVSIGILFLLLLARVNSHKYSLDTESIFTVLWNMISNFSAYNSVVGMHSFNFHFSPGFILISPLYYLGPTLLIFSWKFFCYGAFLFILWRLVDGESRYDLSHWHKNLFLVLIALHPTFISNVVSPEIWDSDLVLPLLGLSILFASRKKYSWAVFWFCLTFLVKEDMMLMGILYGIFLAIHARNAKFLWLSVFSFGWFWIVTHLIMPYFSMGDVRLHLLGFSFGNLGNSMGEIIVNSIINPQLVIDNGWWVRKFSSMFIILLCVGFLPFWNRKALIYLLPILSVLGYTLIAVQPYLDYSKHYMVAIFPFVAWSSYESYVVINKEIRAKLVLFSMLASIAVIVILQMNIRVWSYYFSPIENFHVLESVKEKFIPHGSSMLTGGLSIPWTCRNYNCGMPDFSPVAIEKRKYDYILINLKTVFWEALSCSDESMAINLKKLNGNRKYQVLFYADDIVLLKKNRSVEFPGQPDWSGYLDEFRKINHDCMKSPLMRRLRLF